MGEGVLNMEVKNLQALFIVIDEPERLEEVLEVLLECELRGATIIDSQGMAKVLSNRVPFFAGLSGLLGERKQNKTIFTLSQHPEKFEKAMKKLAEKFRDFEEPCSGLMFTMPVLSAVGLGKRSLRERLSGGKDTGSGDR
jgi:hypothetical protein